MSFTASADFITALDAAAAAQGETRSLRARKVLAQYLREAGHLPTNSPTTRHEARRLAAT